MARKTARQMITGTQIKLIHTLKSALKMPDSDYRAMLYEHYRVESSKELNTLQAAELIRESQSFGPMVIAAWETDVEAVELPEVGDDNMPLEIEAAGQRGSTLDDEELECLLAEMFPDDESEDDGDERRLSPVFFESGGEEKNRRVPVFAGRCIRCGDGYMSNDPERQFEIRDDNVYRCHSCGWRTSPRYEDNRALFAAGGVP